METDFRSLPESMEAEELAAYFNKFLSECGKNDYSLYALKQLYELAYRQWDTYEALNPEIGEKIEAYLMSAMNLKSYEITDVIISIVENLSLKNVFLYLLDCRSSIGSASIRHLIDEAEESYADTIDDPYNNDDDDDGWL